MNSGTKEKVKIYEAIMSSPGMGESCKVSLHLSRHNVLLLCRLIEHGLTSDTNADEMLSLISKEAKEQLLTVVPEFLRRAGLVEFYEKIKSI